MIQTKPRPMSTWRSILPVVLVLTACGAGDRGAQRTQPSGPSADWQLTWSDEFDAAEGSAPDPSRWAFDLGGGGWGNNELQSYTDRRENVSVRSGMLVIHVARASFTGADGIRRDYTSARLKTQNRFTQTHGRFEARIRIPHGQGIWPAFWMLGQDIVSAGWPACGEIDIMENIGREPAMVHGTIHGPGFSGGQAIGAAFTNAGGRRFADDFHIFAIEWEPQTIRWYVDGTLFQTRTAADLPAGARWVFDHPFFLLLNIAVGGNWPGSPDSTTTFPQEMLVDWVRVHRRGP